MRASLDPRSWHRNLSTFQKVAVANNAIIVVGALSDPLITLNFSGRSRLPFLLILAKHPPATVDRGRPPRVIGASPHRLSGRADTESGGEKDATVESKCPQ